jgi:hypothetical protein
MRFAIAALKKLNVVEIFKKKVWTSLGCLSISTRSMTAADAIVVISIAALVWAAVWWHKDFHN